MHSPRHPLMVRSCVSVTPGFGRLPPRRGQSENRESSALGLGRTAQARRAILAPLALCSICGNGSGGTAEDSKPSPPAMGGGPRSIHRLLDSKRSSAFPRGHFLLVGG